MNEEESSIGKRCLDIIFDTEIKKEKDQSCGAMLVRHQESIVLLVVELKRESWDGFRKQTEKQDYIRKMRLFFEKQNPDLVISKEISVCFNLVIDPEIKGIIYLFIYLCTDFSLYRPECF
jgi:hypothetical protein